MKIALMHGKDTDPGGKWYPWLVDYMSNRGILIDVPELPKADDPVIEEWVAEISKTTPDKETVLIGHSRGGVAILRWMEDQAEDVRVKQVILIATNSGFTGDIHISSETNHGFYSVEGYDFDAIKSHCDNFVVMHSHDDQWVPFAAGQQNAAGLDAEFIQLDGYKHFGKGVAVIPELIDALDLS